MAGEEERVDDIKIEPLSPQLAEALRIICTNAGFAPICRFGVCRRQKRCSTRHVLCWQVVREQMNPLINQALAYDWQARVAAGVPLDIPPAREHSFQRILARDREKNPVKAAKWAADAAQNVDRELAPQRKVAFKAAAAAKAAEAPLLTARTLPPPRSRRRRGTGPPAERG